MSAFAANLMLGDCLERMADIADGSVDMILADLPYGTTACKWDNVIPFAPMWAHFKRVCKPNAAIVLTASQPFTSALIMSNIKMFKYCWVWEKARPANFPLAKKQPLKYHEDIAVFSDISPRYFPEMVAGDKVRKKGTNKGYSGFHKGLDRADYLDKKYTDFYPSSVLKFGNSNFQLLHPTQKPVALMAYLIRTYTQPGETVLDCTMGSGTTGVACKQEGRNFIGIERDENYFQIASSRIADCDSLFSAAA